jgi:hypothetical protein
VAVWGVLAAGVLGLAGVGLGAWLTRVGARQGRLEERRWTHIDTVRTLLAKYEWTFDDRRAGLSSEVSAGESLALRAALLALRDPVLDKAVNTYTGGMDWYVRQVTRPAGQGTTAEAEEKGRAHAEQGFRDALDRLAELEERGQRRRLWPMIARGGSTRGTSTK